MPSVSTWPMLGMVTSHLPLSTSSTRWTAGAQEHVGDTEVACSCYKPDDLFAEASVFDRIGDGNLHVLSGRHADAGSVPR